MAKILTSRLMLRTAMLLGICMSEVACAGQRGAAPVLGPSWGEVAIGGVPDTLTRFVQSDCAISDPKFLDCSAVDAAGRAYVFFDGALARISATHEGISSNANLPFDLAFGELLESAIAKVARHTGKKPAISRTGSGERVATWEYAFRSKADVVYSLELVAGAKSGLQELSFVTDF